MSFDIGLLIKAGLLAAAAILMVEFSSAYAGLRSAEASVGGLIPPLELDGQSGAKRSKLPWRRSAFNDALLPTWHLNTTHVPSSLLLLHPRHWDTITMEHARARQCLARRHMLLIGDSLTRYQYLNLAYFLRTGAWESPYPRSEWEMDHVEAGGWPAFYACTQARNGAAPAVRDSPCALQEGRDAILANLSEICDCLRVDNVGVHENRYLLDHGTGGRVTFLQLWYKAPLDWYAPGDVGVDCLAQQHRTARAGGAALASNFTCAQTGCLPGVCNTPSRKGVEVFEGLLQQVSDPLLQPIDLLMINSGLWGMYNRATTVGALIPMLERVQALGNGTTRVVWRTTTAVAPGTEQPYEAETLQAWFEHGKGWGVYDVHAMTTPLAQAVGEQPELERHIFTNPKHYQPWVYRELNRALLHELCG